MLTKAPLDIESLVRNRRTGFSLDAPFYTSPEIFDLDLDLIFGRQWIFVGMEPEVPDAGDYFTVDIGGRSVVILRDDDGEIRAYHNVCRHRGSRLVVEPKGFVGNLVCPYHQWTYDLEGKLIHAQNMAADFDPSCYSLKSVHLRNVGGLIFICLAKEPPADFEEFAAGFLPYVEPHDIRNSKVAAQIDIIEEGNWKITMENNRECYHCGGHPELLGTLNHFFGFTEKDVNDLNRAEYESYLATLDELAVNWKKENLLHEAVEKLDGRSTGFRYERLALRAGCESYTMDGKVASQKLMGRIREKYIGGLHLHFQPNAWFHFLSDHALSFAAIPLAPGKTLVRTTWMVHKDAVEGVDYDLKNLTHVWEATNAQDGAFVGHCQRGASSDAYEPGPYSEVEGQVNKFCNWYIERMAYHLGV